MGRFFLSKITIEDVDKKINEANKIINKLTIASFDREPLIEMLTLRLNDFTCALNDKQKSVTEKELTLAQYDRFANTLLSCLQHPASNFSTINRYQSQKYYPVGVTDVEQKNHYIEKISIAAITLGVSLLCGAIAAFIINPLIAVALVAVAITLLLPSCFFMALPDSLDTTVKKSEERILFQTAAGLVEQEQAPNQVSEHIKCS